MKHLFIFLTAIFMANSTIAQTIEVCKTCPISTLKDGIAQAKDFDTIIVKKMGGSGNCFPHFSNNSGDKRI